MRKGEELIWGRALGQQQPRARATARSRGLGETDNQPDVEDATDAGCRTRSNRPGARSSRHRARVWRDAQKCREMGRRAGAMALPIAPSLHPTPPFLPLIPSPTSLHLVLARVPADCCLLAAALRGETLPFKPLHCPSPSLPSQSALPYSALLAALGCSLVPTRVSPPPPPPSAGSERLA